MGISGIELRGANLLRKTMKILGPKVAPDYCAHKKITDKLITNLTMSSTSAAVCEVNYFKEWEEAVSSQTNILPQKLTINPSGEPYPSYSVGGLMFIPQGKTKSNIISVMSELRLLLPSNALFMNPMDLLHISAFVFTEISSKPIPQEEVDRCMACITQAENLLKGRPPLTFSIVGVNLTKKGVIYLKAYPRKDDLQHVRDEVEHENPWIYHKDVFNITIGRLYKQLTPEEYQRALFNIRRYYQNYYIGDVAFDSIKFMYLKRDALIGLGSAKDIIKEVKLV